VDASAVVLAALILAFASLAGVLGRLSVTAPVVFVGAGALLSGVVPVEQGGIASPLAVVAEVTLALVLFHDASQVRPQRLLADPWPPLRLLLVGLPLTMLLGYLVATALLPGIPALMALLLAAALAPTDAGLGAATVLNPVVPVRVRQLLNVESGLNDGLATPVVLFAIAAVAGAEQRGPTATLGEALVEIAVGATVGVAVGAVGGGVLLLSRRRGLSSRHSRSLGVLALPVLAYFGADLAGGNAFVAAFLAGTAFAGAYTPADHEHPGALTEALSEPLSYAVWTAFGLGATPLVLAGVGWRELAFALLSLTVLRMLPVAVALTGTGMRWQTVAFIGWFGPRGLASVVFALLALESLADDPALDQVLATIACTVLLSVLAHGLSADPLAARYGAWVHRVRPPAVVAPADEPRVRRSMMHRAHERSPHAR
jgi:NhaP-type Na+/H+ or K+/H+ antiporter